MHALVKRLWQQCAPLCSPLWWWAGLTSTACRRRLRPCCLLPLSVSWQDKDRKFTYAVEWSWHAVFTGAWLQPEPDPGVLCPPVPGLPAGHDVCGHVSSE